MNKHTRGTAARAGLRAHVLAAMVSTLVVAAAHAASGDSIVTTVAGGGNVSGEDVAATSSYLEFPSDLVWGQGNLYLAEYERVSRVDANGLIHTVATLPQFEGEHPRFLAIDDSGNLFVAADGRVWKLTPGGTPEPVLGTGTGGAFIDGAIATQTPFIPSEIGVDGAGNLFALSYDGTMIVRVGHDGIARRFAGTGASQAFGDGGPALQAGLRGQTLAVEAHGTVFTSDDYTVRRIAPDGIIDRVTGTRFPFDPMARDLQLQPASVGVDAKGNLMIGTLGPALYLVTPRGAIKAYARNQYTGADHYGGDGGSAMEAGFWTMRSPVTDPAGNTYVIDGFNGMYRVRKITPTAPPALPESADAFGPPTTVDTLAAQTGAAIADVNGDGRNDVLISTNNNGGASAGATDFSVNVYLRLANGTFAARQSNRFVYGSSAAGGGIATADLNKDGKQDVVVGTNLGITIFPGTATGLGTAVGIPGLTNFERVVRVAVTDFDRDGKLDVVARAFPRNTLDYANEQGNTTIFYGNGTLGVARKRSLFTLEGTQTIDFRIADVDRDGLPDLVKGKASGGTMTIDVHYNDGHDNFRTPVAQLPVPSGWLDSIAAGDFNGDGRVDIASTSGVSGLGVHWRDANGGYAYQAPPEAGSPSLSELVAVAADFNNDGWDDLLAAHESQGFWYSEQVKGVLSARVSYAADNYTMSTLANPDAIAVGDVDGDGCKDLVLAQQLNATWTMRRGTGCPRALDGVQPYFGFRGGTDSPRAPAPPTVPAGTSGASATHAVAPKATLQSVWAASQTIMANAWRAFMRDVGFVRVRFARLFGNR